MRPVESTVQASKKAPILDVETELPSTKPTLMARFDE